MEKPVNLNENIAASAATEEDYCECPVCKAKFPAFLPYGIKPRPNAKCPKCKSLERHRELWVILHRLDWHRAGMRVLHVAPERVFYWMFKKLKDIDYWPVDLDPEKYHGRVRKKVDITDIPFEDNSFDLIMCNHVLEHIPDDRKAMSEVYRVLKPKTGIAFLNVPIFNTPATLENPEYNTPELRLKYFGHEDHVRKYGLDYTERLKSVGFRVQIFSTKEMEEETIRLHGFRKNGKNFLCRKE